MKPYMVIAVVPGTADVVDRHSKQRVGYVLQNYRRWWQPFIFDVFGCGRRAGDPHRYRADAAADVWQKWHGGTVATRGVL